MNPENADFFLDFEVRDYECDLQGIVNNAVYQHYLEHTRHKFLIALGLDFCELHRQGMDAVVTKVELEYKQPLKSGDAFFVTLLMEPKGRLQIEFHQKIVRLADNKLILNAKVTAAILKEGRPSKPDLIIRARETYLANRA
jgi:acyl-CoA thioester hydrolase